MAYLRDGIFVSDIRDRSIQQMMHGGGEELGAGGFGLGEFGFQGVAQGQQLGNLGDDSLLLGEGWDRDWPLAQLRHVDRCQVGGLFGSVLKVCTADW